MAVAPVPDQRLYDTIYQERYMGLPENAEGYKQASAINFAEGLKGNLLIVHGSGDDNVHYQGIGAAGESADRARQAVRLHDLPGSDARHLRGTGHDGAPVSPADALSDGAPACRSARAGHQVAHSDDRLPDYGFIEATTPRLCRIGT